MIISYPASPSRIIVLLTTLRHIIEDLKKKNEKNERNADVEKTERKESFPTYSPSDHSTVAKQIAYFFDLVNYINANCLATVEWSGGLQVGIGPKSSVTLNDYLPSNSCFLRPKIPKTEFFFSVSAGAPQRKSSRGNSLLNALRKSSIHAVEEEVHLLSSSF